MIADYSVPPGEEPSRKKSAIKAADAEDQEQLYWRAIWSPDSLTRLTRRLMSDGPRALSSLSPSDLYQAWNGAVSELLDPHSRARRELDPLLAVGCRLSPPALTAALEAMLAGFVGSPARELIERGHSERRSATGERGLVGAIVAGNIPGLAVQAILPALAAGRSLLIKSASREPFFASALVGLLGSRSSALSGALAAATWPGGERALEDPVFALADTLIAYGHEETIGDLEERYRGQLVPLGPKLSIAVVSRDADAIEAGRALATDIALFEQRGCLSVQTIFTDGDPWQLARSLADELEVLARRWPMVPLEHGLAGQIQQLRQVAELTGVEQPELPLLTGTLIIAAAARSGDTPTLEPLPGGRTARIQPVERLSDVTAALRPWHGAIQGAALVGERAWRLQADLERLGVSRLTRPGRLQRPDALWANGKRHLVDVLLD